MPTPRHPQAMLSLPTPRAVSTPHSGQHFPPPIPIPGAVMGWGEGGGRAEPYCSPSPSCAQHRRAPGPSPGGGFLNPIDVVPPPAEAPEPPPPPAQSFPGAGGWAEGSSAGTPPHPNPPRSISSIRIGCWRVPPLPIPPPHPLTLSAGSRGGGQGEHREAQQPPAPEPGHGSAEPEPGVCVGGDVGGGGWRTTSPTL